MATWPKRVPCGKLTCVGVGGGVAEGKGHGHGVSYEYISQISICFAVKQTV